MEYGLIGGRLGHSYSKLIHQRLEGYDYRLVELPTEAEARAFLEKRAFRAVNVTIPYKQLVIPYCAGLDEKARAIGVVNTLVNKNGLLYGYNTDFDGLSFLARRAGVDFAGKTVLILGTGGTSRTAAAVARAGGAKEILFASRTPGPGRLSYDQAARCPAQVVINTTPAGMYPNCGGMALDPAGLPRLEAALDAVYNPFFTPFVQAARARGAAAAGGLWMLVAQAVYAAALFAGGEPQTGRIEPIAREIFKGRANISLVGMPSCGKSTIGRMLAKSFGKAFVDIDAEIVKAAGRSIPEIFAAEGEAGFRDLEQQVTARLAKEGGQVLSAGGGAVLRRANVTALRQNGPVVFIDRPLGLLRTGGGRPLSTDRAALAAMEQTRRPLYEAAADIRVENGGDVFRRAAEQAKEALCAYFGS